MTVICPRDFSISWNVSLRQKLSPARKRQDWTMMKERFSVKQIVRVLNHAEVGVP